MGLIPNFLYDPHPLRAGLVELESGLVELKEGRLSISFGVLQK